jgi:hypothetical protein
MKVEPIDELLIKESLHRTSQNNFNQASAGYNAKWFRRGGMFVPKWYQKQRDTSKVTRVEVIQHSPPHNGRAFTNYNAEDVDIQIQDDGKTLKIFLK